MVRRRLLLVERSLDGAAAELQETELPSLALLPFLTPQQEANSSDSNRSNTTRTDTPQSPPASVTSSQTYPAALFSVPDASGGSSAAGVTERRPVNRQSPSELESTLDVPELGAFSLAQVAERAWEAVDEGNRVVLLGRLFELSQHPECFRGVPTDTTFVRLPHWPLVF